MQVTKMQGLGNTFTVITGPITLAEARARELCKDNRSDALLVVSAIDQDSIRMEYWNSDGTKAEMCGNGLRCSVRFAIDSNMAKPGTLKVETDAGPLQAIWDGKDPNAIEVQVGKVAIDDDKVMIDGLKFTTASVGNPHAVTFVDDISDIDAQTIGPRIETDSHFPNRTNVEFVQKVSDSEIRLRVWERGVGETMACGTAMVASAKAAGAASTMIVHVPGGSAKVWVDEQGYSRMRAPALYMD